MIRRDLQYCWGMTETRTIPNVSHVSVTKKLQQGETVKIRQCLQPHGRDTQYRMGSISNSNPVHYKILLGT